MDLENNNNNCSDDYVSVLEGNDNDAPEIGRYCGTTVPSAITSVGSALVVKFMTDASHQRRGFQAVYTKSTSGQDEGFVNHRFVETLIRRSFTINTMRLNQAKSCELLVHRRRNGSAMPAPIPGVQREFTPSTTTYYLKDCLPGSV